MNIVMIGDSAVGKTTLMMSTYGLMADGEIEGFRVECKNEQVHKKLVRAYNDFRTKGQYPPATVKMDTYNYDFYSNADWVMNFSLTDIRGESIHDYDVKDLSSQLRNADAMMLFLNGYDIANGEDVTEQLDDIYVLLNNCFISDEKEKLIIVIFSQMDRIKNFDSKVWESMNDSVRELKQMEERNSKITYMAIPTACSLDCMMDLDFTMVSLMLFGYYNEVLERKQKLEAELESINEQWGNNDPMLKKAGRFILDAYGLDFQRNKARARAKELEKKLQDFNEMVDKFNRLKKFHDDYEVGTSYKIKRRESSLKENVWDL